MKSIMIKKTKHLLIIELFGITLTICGLLGTCSSSSLTMSWCKRSSATSLGKRSIWSVISRFAYASSNALQAWYEPSRAARNNGVSSCKENRTNELQIQSKILFQYNHFSLNIEISCHVVSAISYKIYLSTELDL